MPVANGMPLAAIGAGEEVPPCCVTIISANACRVPPSCSCRRDCNESHRSLCLDSEDAAYMVTLAAVR